MAGLRQANSGTAAAAASLAAPPLEGSLVVLQHTSTAVPAGFTDLTGLYADFALGNTGFRLAGRIAAFGDNGVYATAPGEYNIAEFEGFGLPALDPQTAIRQAYVARAHVATDPTYTGEVLVLGAFIQDGSVGQALTPDAGYAIAAENESDSNQWTITLTYRVIGTNAPPYDPGLTNPSGAGNWAAAAVAFGGDADPGGEVPLPEPLDPGRAIIEIYTSPADSDRWDEAVWGTGVWSAAEWVDISPWCVTADVVWGADRGDYGILAKQVAGSWVIATFDPDRVLDPSNADSPFYPELVAGLPIRINHEAVTIRTGIVRRLTYSHADKGGSISATDTISTLANAKVPEDTVLSDTLFARIREAIEAAGLSIPVRRENAGASWADPPLSPAPAGEFSVWEVIQHAALEVLHVAMVNSAGEVSIRPWDYPLRAGYELASPELVDLEAWIDDVGLYSVVRTLDHGTATVVERRATPTPYYGERVYERDEATINGGTWADAILADRRDQSLRFIPGDVRPLTAASVRTLVRRQVMEEITLSVPEADPDVTVAARILGVRVRVWDETTEYPDNIRTRWRWRFVTTQAAVAPLIADGVNPQQFIFNDDDPTDPLYPDGVTGL